MLRIGEFSQLAQVSVRMLRHYDDLGLLKPAEIDRFTDYRYYRVDQLPRLNRILVLKDLGFSLGDIGRLLRDDLPAEQLRGMLKLRRVELADEIREGQARLARVETRLRDIEHEGAPPHYDVMLKPAVSHRIASRRAIVPTLDHMATVRCALYESLYERFLSAGLAPTGRELAIYHTGEYSEHDIDMEAAVVVSLGDTLEGDGIFLRELAAESAVASTVHRGAFIDVARAMQALFGWVGANALETTGPVREWHIFGRELDLDDAGFDDVVIELQVPVKPAAPAVGAATLVRDE